LCLYRVRCRCVAASGALISSRALPLIYPCNIPADADAAGTTAWRQRPPLSLSHTHTQMLSSRTRGSSRTRVRTGLSARLLWVARGSHGRGERHWRGFCLLRWLCLHRSHEHWALMHFDRSSLQHPPPASMGYIPPEQHSTHACVALQAPRAVRPYPLLRAAVVTGLQAVPHPAARVCPGGVSLRGSLDD
jgi:hypothetical protein